MARKKSSKETRIRSARVVSLKEDAYFNDSDSMSDVCSVTSGACSVNSLPLCYDSATEDHFIVDDFESDLGQVLDYLQNGKASTKSRLAYFEFLKKAMSTRFCMEFFLNHTFTMQDILERAIKRVYLEGESAISTLSMFLITMATQDDYCDTFFRSIFDSLYRLLLDPTAKLSVRAKCAEALSLGCFITDYGTDKSQEVLQQLLCIAFDNKNSSTSEQDQMYVLESTCLNMFSFLISIHRSSFAVKCFRENATKLCNSLESPSLAVRMAAGECIALMIERFKLDGEDFELPQLEEMCDLLHILATDSQKWRSKSDLRQQRSIFRQIQATVQGGSYSGKVVTLTAHDRIVISDWQSKRYYDTLCSILGSGIRLHLSQNQFLRDLFQLGPVSLPLCSDDKQDDISKGEKNLYKNIIRKYRQTNRAKVRGKRVDDHNTGDFYVYY